LTTNSVLLLQPTHTPEQKYVGAITHGILNGTAFIFFTTAVAIIFINKNLHNAAHFTTAHGRIGLFVYILLLIQVISFCALLIPDLYWHYDVLFSASFWIGRKGKGYLEISQSKRIHCLDPRTRQLRVRDAEHMVSRGMEYYVDLGCLHNRCSPRRGQSHTAQQDENFLDTISNNRAVAEATPIICH